MARQTLQLLCISVLFLACDSQDDRQAPVTQGPALKSLHLITLPGDVSDEEVASALNVINERIADLGYPQAGYRMWKANGEVTTGYTHLWEGYWPSQAAYDEIHESEEYKQAGESNQALWEKLWDLQVYQRYAEVVPPAATSR